MVRSFDSALVLAPDATSGAPQIAWGDYFFYYSPDGQVPRNEQPYATVVTKNYPDDTQSALDAPDRWRVNVHVGRAVFGELTADSPSDFAATDVFLPHPVYGALGWVSVVNPGERTTAKVLDALRTAHEDARRRFERRKPVAGSDNADAPKG